MMQEPEIRVGLITDGAPVIDRSDDLTTVSNLLIGENFHWQEKRVARFKGRIESLKVAQGNIHVVNILPLEDYVSSVTASEMNPNAPLEFLKAHAVISRSWALRKILGLQPDIHAPEKTITWEESDTHTGFDVCSDDHCQRYQGVAEPMAQRSIEAMESTRGEVLTDSGGAVADARFSKCCGGRTEIFSTCWADTDYNYLQSVDDPWCDLSDMPEPKRTSFLDSILKNYDRPTLDFHDWETTVGKSDLAMRLLDRFDINVGNITHISAHKTGLSGRIKELEIKGTSGSVIVGKELTIRRLMAPDCLYSSWFDITDEGEAFRLRGHGWGHGVGLCQIGAARMAHEGKDYREILSFYYRGSEIRKAYE